jgi:hypothetical protein
MKLRGYYYYYYYYYYCILRLLYLGATNSLRFNSDTFQRHWGFLPSVKSHQWYTQTHIHTHIFHSPTCDAIQS